MSFTSKSIKFKRCNDLKSISLRTWSTKYLLGTRHWEINLTLFTTQRVSRGPDRIDLSPLKTGICHRHPLVVSFKPTKREPTFQWLPTASIYLLRTLRWENLWWKDKVKLELETDPFVSRKMGWWCQTCLCRREIWRSTTTISGRRTTTRLTGLWKWSFTLWTKTWLLRPTSIQPLTLWTISKQSGRCALRWVVKELQLPRLWSKGSKCLSKWLILSNQNPLALTCLSRMASIIGSSINQWTTTTSSWNRPPTLFIATGVQIKVTLKTFLNLQLGYLNTWDLSVWTPHWTHRLWKALRKYMCSRITWTWPILRFTRALIMLTSKPNTKTISLKSIFWDRVKQPRKKVHPILRYLQMQICSSKPSLKQQQSTQEMPKSTL